MLCPQCIILGSTWDQFVSLLMMLPNLITDRLKRCILLGWNVKRGWSFTALPGTPSLSTPSHAYHPWSSTTVCLFISLLMDIFVDELNHQMSVYVIINKAAGVGTELFSYLAYMKSARGVALLFCFWENGGKELWRQIDSGSLVC